jgi:hypothetical protein
VHLAGVVGGVHQRAGVGAARVVADDQRKTPQGLGVRHGGAASASARATVEMAAGARVMAWSGLVQQPR